MDLCVTAITKYPSGASDLMMGAISANRKASDLIKEYKIASGLCGSNHSSYTVLKSLKSLSVRMVHHHVCALKIAKFLEAVNGVVRVLCPGLPGFPCYRL